MAEPGPHVEIYTEESDPGLFFNDFDLWRHVPVFREFALEGPLAAIAAALSGASTITFFYDQVFVKEPGTEGLTQWHQDQPYMAVDGQQLCSNWIPLDPITPETTLEFVRGSHLWGRWFAPFRQHAGRHPAMPAPRSSAARISRPRARTTTSSRGSWSPETASSSRG